MPSKKIEKICFTCGIVFFKFPSELIHQPGSGKYCSYRCRRKRIIVKCKECGEDFETHPCIVREGGGKFCSKKCRTSFQRVPLIERFFDKIGKMDASGCVVWKGGISGGYGSINDGKKIIRATRVSYELFHGEFPKELCVLHICDNRLCVRPSHLFVGTRGQNNTDRSKKLRSAFGEKSAFSKLNSEQVLEIRRRFESGDTDLSNMAKDFDVTKEALIHIITRKTWRHI